MCSAIHRASGTKVAIKRIQPLEHSSTSVPSTLRDHASTLTSIVRDSVLLANVARIEAAALFRRAERLGEYHFHRRHRQTYVLRVVQGGISRAGGEPSARITDDCHAQSFLCESVVCIG